ncbi:MAG: GIY-YIG nuclease family protein [Staphylothermus sp.]|nr:GIY-YIG nuclease family protein [Staphylothermus sp.]
MNFYEYIPSLPGYYLLIFRIYKKLTIITRGNKVFSLNPGIYVYIGSAYGPGGLRSRIIRHLRRNKKVFWHVDYLTTNKYVELVGFVIITITSNKTIDLENLLSKKIQKHLEPILGFGCSDKRKDKSHLYYCMKNFPDCLRIIDEILSSIKNIGIEYTINILTPINI